MMLAVNLLPWRSQRMQRRRQQSVVQLLTLAVLVSAVVLALWGRGAIRLKQQADRQHAGVLTLNMLQQQLSQQQALLQQRDALQRLQRSQLQRQRQHVTWQDFWQKLPALMPDTLWLSRLERRQGELVLEGMAASMAAVSDFRRRLLRQPLLISVKQGDVQRQSEGGYRFALRARVQEVNDE